MVRTSIVRAAGSVSMATSLAPVESACRRVWGAVMLNLRVCPEGTAPLILAVRIPRERGAGGPVYFLRVSRPPAILYNLPYTIRARIVIQDCLNVRSSLTSRRPRSEGSGGVLPAGRTARGAGGRGDDPGGAG